MTLAQHLPVYKASYDLTLSLFLVIKKFPKEFKYTLGEQLKKDCLMLISSLYKTNTLLHKKESLIETRATLEGIRVLLRLSKDLHIIAVERFVVLSESIETISKQLLAWERKSQSGYEGGGSTLKNSTQFILDTRSDYFPYSSFVSLKSELNIIAWRKGGRNLFRF